MAWSNSATKYCAKSGDLPAPEVFRPVIVLFAGWISTAPPPWLASSNTYASWVFGKVKRNAPPRGDGVISTLTW